MGSNRSASRWCGGLCALVSLAALVGCSGKSYQAYSGPPLGREQVAILRLEGDRGAVGVAKVDETVVQFHGGDSIELLPGQHTIEFTPHPSIHLNEPYFKQVSVEAGKTYRAWGEVSGKRQNILQEMGGIPVKVAWRVNVEETKEASR